MTNCLLWKLYCMGKSCYTGIRAVRPNKCLFHAETSISTDGNTLNGGVLEMIHDVAVEGQMFSWKRLCASDAG